MPSPVFTPGEGGGKPVKPQPETAPDFPWLVPQPQPEPEPEVTPVTPMVNIVSSNTQPSVYTPENPPPRTMSGPGYIVPGVTLSGPGETPPTKQLKEVVLPDIGNAQQSPIDSADIKFYLAAPHNSVLNEVRLMCQYESIPPAWRDRPDLFLWLCAEYGIDEENDAEARDYLDQIKNGGSSHQNTDDPLHVAWKAAHESYNPEVKDEATEVTNYRVQIKSTYGVELTSLDGAEDWDLLRVRMVHVGLEMAAAALGEMARQMGLDWGDITAFRRIIGYIELRLTKEPHDEDAYAVVFGRIITFYLNGYPYPDLLLHELGHVFNTHAGLGNEDGAGSINMTTLHPNTREGLGKADPEKLRLFDVLGLTENDKLISGVRLDDNYLIMRLQQSWESKTNEYTADGFLNWIFYRNTLGVLGFADTDKGREWQEFMDENMDVWIRNAIVHNARRDISNLPVFLEHNRIPGFVGMATVGNYPQGVKVRSEASTAQGNATVVGSLQPGDEVVEIGEREGEIDGISGQWTAIIFKGSKRWVASFLLESPDNIPPPLDDVWLNFDGAFSRARDRHFFSDLVRYLDTGAENA